MKKIILWHWNVRALVMGIALLMLLVTPAKGAGGPETEKTFRWKLQHYAPAAAEGYAIYCEEFAALVKAMSGGRLIIQTYPAGTLMPATEMLGAVKNGVIEMAVLLAAYHTGIMPIGGLSYGFPGTYRNYEDQMIHKEYFGFYDVLERAYKEQGGVHFIRPSGQDSGFALISKVPITEASDFRGLKLRGTGGVGLMLKELGASVIAMGGAELYTALSQGTIDGVVYGSPSTLLGDMRFHEVTSYLVQPNLVGSHGSGDYVVNQKAWNSLPEDLKAIVMAAANNKAIEFRHRVNYEDIKDIREYIQEKKAIKISRLSDGAIRELTKASRTALEKWVAEKNDPYLSEGAETLIKFMEWRGYLE